MRGLRRQAQAPNRPPLLPFGPPLDPSLSYVYDPDKVFPPRVNPEMVSLERVEDFTEAEELRLTLQQHRNATGSSVATTLLEDWEGSLQHFVKVMPNDYRAVLEAQAAAAASISIAAAEITPKASSTIKA